MSEIDEDDERDTPDKDTLEKAERLIKKLLPMRVQLREDYKAYQKFLKTYGNYETVLQELEELVSEYRLPLKIDGIDLAEVETGYNDYTAASQIYELRDLEPSGWNTSNC